MTRVPSPRPRSHPRRRMSCLRRFALLATLAIPTTLVAGAYGDWVDAPGLEVPGRPVAELAVSGETFLLLETLSPEGALAADAPTFGALLWNPTTSLPLDPPADRCTAVQENEAEKQPDQYDPASLPTSCHRRLLTDRRHRARSGP